MQLCIHVCVLLSLSVCSSGSLVSMVTTPNTFQPTLSESLRLACNLNVTHSAAGLVGRSLTTTTRDIGQSLTTTAGDIHSLTSLVVRRDGQDIAAVTTDTSARALDDVDNVSVVGALGESGFIELTWQYPTTKQSGNYTCDVTGVDTGGRPVTLSTSALVKATPPSIGDLVTHIHMLKLQSDAQQQVNHVLTSQHQEMNSRVASLENVVEKSRHVEHGVVSCTHAGSSQSWPTVAGAYISTTVTMNFTKSYSEPPVVFLGGATYFWNYDHADDDYSVLYEVELTHVNTTGFTVTCWTLKEYNGAYYIRNLDVNWMSFFDSS